jgi:hypothetical protein
MSRTAFPALAILATACGTAPASSPPPPAPPAPVAIEAGFVDVPARDVTVKGQAVHIAATGRLFYNLRPADVDPATKPIFFLFNGFAAEVVRGFGTGPTTVAEGGDVVANPSSYTQFGNLVYLEPRQAGYSYDVLTDRAPGAADCAPGIFNEYVDAADVLLGALAFLDAHPQLRGPVYWVGESYAGVRVTWILAYLRGRWDLANYADPTLAAKLAKVQRTTSLRAGQILLEGWLAGGAHASAIVGECTDPAVLAGVSASVSTACTGADACACANMNDRSPYNYTYTVEHQTTRETEASAAHIEPPRAAALIGVPLTSIPLLAAAERAKGFKCAAPDATVPAEDPLVTLLGALPAGQSYYVPYSPLLPGKETAPTTLDWRTANFEAIAFADNLHDVPAFVTAGARDLVVPPGALVPALRASLGADRIDDSSTTRLGLRYSDGERFIDLFAYAESGHMVEMTEPAALAKDIGTWLARGP